MRFLALLIMTLLAALAAIGGLNHAVDPAGIRAVQDAGARTACGPGLRTERRWTLPLTLAHGDPAYLISGTSRTMRGFAEADLHRHFGSDRVLNMAAPGMLMEEIGWLLAGPLRAGRVKQVLLGVEFGLFSEQRLPTHEHIDRHSTEWRPVKDRFQPWLSLEATQASLRALQHDCPPARTTATGFPSEKPAPRFLPEPTPRGFIHNSETTSARLYREGITSRQAYHQRMAVLDALLATGCAQGTAFDLAILPAHARIHAIHARAGLQPAIADWKRELAGMADRWQQRGCAVRVTDFATLNALTLASFRTAGGSWDSNAWYYEPSHFKPVLGNCVLAALRGDRTACLAGGFGVTLDSSTVEAHLQWAQANYAAHAAGIHERPARNTRQP